MLSLNLSIQTRTFIKILSASAAMSITLGGCTKPIAKVTLACEKEVKARLLSPTGYKRVSVTETIEAIPIDDYLKRDPDYHKTDAVSRKVIEMERRDLRPIRYTVDLEYDASNAFGTPIRTRSICEYVAGGADADISDSLVTVDGETSTDRVLENAKSALDSYAASRK